MISPKHMINHLDLDSALDSLPPLLHACVGLGSHDTSTPVADGLGVLLEVAVLDGRDELGELALVLGSDLGEGENGGGLKAKLEVDLRENFHVCLTFW
jgi:hypothetical protein